MSENPIHAELSKAEWSLIQAIRALPERDMRDRMHELMGELVFYVKTPRCQGMGVEGFPCGDPVASCDDCQHIWDALEAISERLEKTHKEI